MDSVRNCAETTTLVKEFEKNIISKEGFSFEKFKETDRFKEMYKKNDVSKTHKNIGKVSKTQSGNEFEYFNNIEIC